MKHYLLIVDSDHPDAERLIREGAVNLVCDVDWDDGQSTTVAGLLEYDGEMPVYQDHCTYLAGWRTPPEDGVTMHPFDGD